MTDLTPYPVFSKPGIKRDGTKFDGEYHVDGRWVRWVRGRPQKIGGFKDTFPDVTGIARGLWSHASNGLQFVHAGSQTKLQRFTLNLVTSVITVTVDRTPAVDFDPSADNMWQMDMLYDATSAASVIIAHAAPNALDIASDTAGFAFLADSQDSSAFASITGSEVSGGISVFHPYLMLYGSDGVIINSVPNKPADLSGVGSNTARITHDKIVRALPSRGGAGNNPSGLIWSLTRLIRASFSGGATVFNFDTLSDQSSIIAAMSVVELDGVFYWVGQGRFFMFNGVLQELPNPLSKDWFFDNINWQHRNKTFGFAVPRYSEIWWCYPRGAATEPSHAVIFNAAEQTWYDTELPHAMAGAFSPKVSRYPIVSSAVLSSEGTSAIHEHELGWDEVSGSPLTAKALQSYFETGDLSYRATQGAPDRSIHVECVEPDFVQVGDMTMEIVGRANARATEVTSSPFTIVANPATPDEQLVWPRERRREMRFRFGSNVAGGYYKGGATIAHIGPAGGRRTGG